MFDSFLMLVLFRSISQGLSLSLGTPTAVSVTLGDFLFGVAPRVFVRFFSNSHLLAVLVKDLLFHRGALASTHASKVA